MRTIKFKTNIKCAGCISAVSPYLNNVDEIKNWEVNTDSPDKILTVNAEDISVSTLISKVKQAGYRAEPIHAN